MIASILLRAFLFALPFIFYEIYLRLQRLQDKEPVARRKPWTKIFIAGFLLVAISLLIEGFMSGETIKGRYIPPHMEDGKVVPGHMEGS